MAAYSTIFQMKYAERKDKGLKLDRHIPAHGPHSNPSWQVDCLIPLGGQLLHGNTSIC